MSPRCGHRRAAVLGTVVVLLLSGCGAGGQGGSGSATEGSDTSASDTATRDAAAGDSSTPESSATGDPGAPTVVDTVPREPTFTQGLERLPDGTMVHSRGGYGESGIDLLAATGEVVRSQELPDEEFGEGVTVVPGGSGGDDTAYQLTWKSGVVHTWSLPDLRPGPSLRIDGEGWGLCYDATREVLWQSDGSARLRSLRPSDLSPQQSVQVTEDGRPVSALNELECADGMVWANVWQSSDIVRIDPSDGRVGQRLELDAVVRAEGRQDAEEVLNGIARSPEGALVVTGKNWERLYRLNVPAAG